MQKARARRPIAPAHAPLYYRMITLSIGLGRHGCFDITERWSAELAEPRLLRKAAFIGGSWSGAATEIDVHNPADAALIASVPDVGATGAVAAIDAADALPRWALLTASERARALRRWYDLITHHKEDLARLLTVEQGKPISELRQKLITRLLISSGFLRRPGASKAMFFRLTSRESDFSSSRKRSE